jgi:hypothetical protein
LSASRKILTICSSLYRLFFIAPSLLGAIFSNSSWSENLRTGQWSINRTCSLCFAEFNLLMDFGSQLVASVGYRTQAAVFLAGYQFQAV